MQQLLEFLRSGGGWAVAAIFVSAWAYERRNTTKLTQVIIQVVQEDTLHFERLTSVVQTWIDLDARRKY
jgi:hypothetical protein